jgi:hypothetical protein
MALKRQKKVNGLGVRLGAVGSDCVTPVSHFGAVDMGPADLAIREPVLPGCSESGSDEDFQKLWKSLVFWGAVACVSVDAGKGPP